MSRNIWKYPLRVTDRQVIQMPAGAKPLHVGVQNEELMLWVEVVTTNHKESVEVRIYGTGWELPSNPGKYLGTFFSGQGAFVWHVYLRE
jgi:hypothetical protein